MPIHILALALTLAAPAAAHIALWDPAMYGWNASDPNQNDAVTPLYNLTFDEWWFHGYIDQPPAADTFMSLPAGGIYHGQVACNKAFTSYGDSATQEELYYACDTIGALHTSDAYGTASPTDVKGCALSIAYESDPQTVQPEDFAVVSTNASCPWFKDVDFAIPADIPACPADGCTCQFNWVHSDDSGSEQIYSLMYRCNVTGATATEAIPSSTVANKCDYPTDTSNCTVGPRQPFYWLQAERNNIFQGYYDPPYYNGAYGFMDGAQTDLFAASNASTSANSTNSANSTISTNTAAASDAGISLMISATVNVYVAVASAPISASASSVSSSMPSVSSVSFASASSPTVTSTGGSCKRRKRALDVDDQHVRRVSRRSRARRAEGDST
ncbi:hypothetical protein Q5752_003615 [Cryptotrichosporon argae]